MSEKKSIARLFVAYSDDPKHTLVVRRGPAKHVAVFNWDRTKNKFTLGQWLKGRIYEHRLDISPDGKHWIYLALQGIDTHTVVAKTPFLKAIDYYPWGGTWGGGGHFVTSKQYILSGSSMGEPRISGSFIINQNEWNKEPPIYSRLKRQGWELKSNGDFTRELDKGWVIHKHLGSGQKLGRSVESEWHSLSHVGRGLTLERPSWEWADISKDKLVFAEKGRLMRAIFQSGAETYYRTKLIHDFNNYKFENLRAPY